jgi:hypothetical protein
MQKSLLDWLVELMQRDYPEHWARLCRIAHAMLPSVPAEGTAHWLLSHHRRGVVHLLPFETPVCRECIQLFADAFRDRMVGRIEGTLEMKQLDPRLISVETLRFNPDELVLDEGALIVVDVRVVEPAPDRSSSAAILEPEMRSEPEQPPNPALLPDAAASPVRKLSGKVWVSSNFKSELLDLTITEAANLLAKQSETAANCIKPLQPRYVEKVLRDLGLWPKVPWGSPKQRPSK